VRRPCFLLLTAFACAKTPAPEGAPPKALAPIADRSGSGELQGHVRFHGTPPGDVARPSKLAFPECSRFGPAASTLRLAADGAVADAFVWVKTGLPEGREPIPSEPVVLDQRGCEFVPRVFGVQVGQPVEIRNSDPFLHNTHAFAGGFNVPLPTQGAKVTRSFPRPEVPAVIGCDVHGWMRAYAGVVPHRFYAVTGEDGAFDIRGLPPGHFGVEVWQERLGRRAAEVDLGDGGLATLDFELK
jgi:hypothetical protein